MWTNVAADDLPESSIEVPCTKEKAGNVDSIEMLCEIVNFAQEGMMLLDANRKIIFFSGGCEKMTGWSAAQVLGKSCRAVFKCENRRGQRVFEPDCCGLQAIGTMSPQKAELIVSARGGRSKWVEVSYSPIPDALGQPYRLIAVMRDVSSRHQTDEIQSSILSTVSHELRTPLTSIRAISELLLVHQFSLTECRDLIQDVHREAQRLEGLISDILDVSRIEAHRIDCRRLPTSLLEVVEQSVAAFERQDMKQGIVTKIPSDLPLVLADRQHLRRIFDNLLANAIKYSPRGRSITVEASEANRKVLVNIADEGMGIPPEDLPRIFEKFYRVDSPDNHKFPGVGLGLYLVKNLVELNGGQIWVDSEVSAGSTFTFTLIKA